MLFLVVNDGTILHNINLFRHKILRQLLPYYMLKYFLLLFSLLSFAVFTTNAQRVPVKDSGHYVISPASNRYYKSGIYKFFWGEHYRKDWHQAVSFPKVNIDTLAGGLHPYQMGGGRQSKSIRLRDKNEHEYVMRSIDKSFGKALPGIAQNTFVESIANDQVTISHPYAAVIVAPLAEAAGIYHTNPKIYFVPKQSGLKQFSDSTGDQLYLFEQRPDEDWSTASNFGNSNKIVSTEKMLEKILKDNDNSVDQKAFVRARLFDIFIGDWGRHEDQWRWASFKDGKKTVYRPIPRDRDNAFTVFDGVLLKVLIKAARAQHLQTFNSHIKDVTTFNFPARNLDHHLMGEVTMNEWMSIANDLKARMTDAVIDAAVRQLPARAFPVSGPGIAKKLKQRRDDMDKWAKQYYLFLSKEVELTGTEDDERFEIVRASDTGTQINIYKITNSGTVKNKPYYSRTFDNRETKEVRIYGIKGKDEYDISGDVNKSLKLRLIGGDGKDAYIDRSKIRKNGKRTIIYDDHGNDIKKSGETKLHLSADSSIHEYDYRAFKPDVKLRRAIIFYSNEDRFHVGYSFLYQHYKWRKQPFGTQQYADIKYSFAQKAISSTYAGTFAQLAGKWDINLYANFDAIRWTNFYGLGNETVKTTDDRDYNRVRSRQFIGKIGLQRVWNNRHRIGFNPYFQSYDVINDTARFLAKTPVSNAGTYHTNNYVGAELTYVYQNINDSALPTKGFVFTATGIYSHNLKVGNRELGKFGSEAQVLLPISQKLGLFIKAGGTTLTGTPEFFQYNTVGTTETLRGHQRDRFYGNSTAYNQNELRWITNVRSYVFNGKMGFFGLYDVGRAWLKGETSDRWHTSYGGGIILSPFNRLSVKAAYAKSEEDYNIHLSLIKVL